MQVFLTESSWHSLLVCADSSFPPLLLQGSTNTAKRFIPPSKTVVQKPNIKHLSPKFLAKSKGTPENIPQLSRPICWKHIRDYTSHITRAPTSSPKHRPG